MKIVVVCDSKECATLLENAGKELNFEVVCEVQNGLDINNEIPESEIRLSNAVLFAIDALVLAVIVLMQEGKSAGLTGTISGMADTYWGKNKGRSMEGKLEKITKILAVVFFVLALALNMSWGR